MRAIVQSASHVRCPSSNSYFVLVKDCEKIATQHKQEVNDGQLDLRTDTFQFQIHIGSEKYPDNACVGVAESFHRLNKLYRTKQTMTISA